MMKAIVLKEPGKLELENIPKPTVSKGKVLVKMAYTPINPSDLSFITGNYGLKKALPVVPGLEGSGIVVESGGGLMASFLNGKRVACAAPTSGNGTWAEYMLTDASKCVPLKKEVSMAQGSMLFVNPLTALAFINKTKQIGADVIVMNAAGSALASMVRHLAKIEGIDFFAITRTPNVDLEKEGGFEVICTAETDFEERLKSLASKRKKAIFFDAVGGGDLPFRILNCLPAKSTMVIYGRLLLEKAIMETGMMIFKNYSIEGFWLSNAITEKSMLQSFLDTRKVQDLLVRGFETKIQSEVTIDQFKLGLADYQSQMSAGKVLLKF